MTKPTITVITPCLPADAELLVAAYESLTTQTGTDWRWIVSEDGPAGPVAAALPADERITVLSAARPGGAAHARNVALGQVDTPFVRNLDADDMLAHPRALADAVAALEGGADFAVSEAADFFSDESELPVDVTAAPGRIARGALVEAWRADPSHVPVHPTTLAARTDAALAVGGWGGLRLGEDTDLLMRLNAVFDGWLLERPATLYRKREDQVTAQPRNNNAADRRLRRAFTLASADALAGRYDLASAPSPDAQVLAFPTRR